MSKKDEEIRESRLNVAIRAGFCCEVCGKSLALERGELAHQIPQRKHLIEKYGAGVIHHVMNFKWTCPECNSAVSIGGDPKAQDDLARKIRLYIYAEAAARIEITPHLYRPTVDKLAKIARGAA